MKAKRICLLLLAVIAGVAAQGEDELHIPVENDNQFPPDKHSEPDGTVIEGSGEGAIEEPIDATTESKAPLIEDVQIPVSIDTDEPLPNGDESSCPKPCVCNIEGDSNSFIVDCSGYDLKEFPKSIDAKTTTLNMQNNKLTEIPKEISSLKNLKVLNVNNNSIMELVSGSISELPELTVLKLGNNRLIEYPKDLKNSFGLTKLEELDLGGNDMRTPFTHETFSNFKALRKLILPTSTSELLENLCGSLKESLDTICTETCSSQSYECPDAPESFDEGLLKAVLPGVIALSSEIEDNVDPAVSEDSTNVITNSETVKTPQVQTEQTNVESPSSSATETSSVSNVNTTEVNNEFSLRSAVIEASDGAAQINSVVETAKEGTNDNKETDVAVGATTLSTKTGGVDKNVIGIIVAGMVLVVAGITIKKNWSSIKNRFSSSPRAANDRTGANANGTTPEEVPLQDKSPV